MQIGGAVAVHHQAIGALFRLGSLHGNAHGQGAACAVAAHGDALGVTIPLGAVGIDIAAYRAALIQAHRVGCHIGQGVVHVHHHALDGVSQPGAPQRVVDLVGVDKAAAVDVDVDRTVGCAVLCGENVDLVAVAVLGRHFHRLLHGQLRKGEAERGVFELAVEFAAAAQILGHFLTAFRTDRHEKYRSFRDGFRILTRSWRPSCS